MFFSIDFCSNIWGSMHVPIPMGLLEYARALSPILEQKFGEMIGPLSME